MAELLSVPEVAAGSTEVVLSEWMIEPGEVVSRGDVIAVVETDKAVVEVEADRTATVLRLLAAAGSSVAVGAPLVLLGSNDELEADLDSALAELGVGEVSATPAPERRDIPEAAEPEAPAAEPAPTSTGGARRYVSPIARKLLADAGVSSDQIQGTGPRGRIRRRDVEPAIKAASEASSVEPAETTAGSSQLEPDDGPWTDLPHSRVRRAVARRLTESKQQVPHFYLRRTARIDELLALRAELNEASPVKLSVNDFLVRAIGVAHVAVPDANVTWTEDAIRRYDGVDVSVAIASERGLVTPVVRGVEGRSLSSISAEVKHYVALAGDGRLQQRDLEGGSITISNLGMFGVDEFDAIINPPQALILAVGAARSEPAVVDGEVVPATVLSLVASVDHRAVDGALGAQWLAALVDALERPLRLLV